MEDFRDYAAETWTLRRLSGATMTAIFYRHFYIFLARSPTAANEILFSIRAHFRPWVAPVLQLPTLCSPAAAPIQMSWTLTAFCDASMDADSHAAPFVGHNRSHHPTRPPAVAAADCVCPVSILRPALQPAIPCPEDSVWNWQSLFEAERNIIQRSTDSHFFPVLGALKKIFWRL